MLTQAASAVTFVLDDDAGWSTHYLTAVVKSAGNALGEMHGLGRLGDEFAKKIEDRIDARAEERSESRSEMPSVTIVEEGVEPAYCADLTCYRGRDHEGPCWSRGRTLGAMDVSMEGVGRAMGIGGRK